MFERICGEMWSVTPYALCDHRCVVLRHRCARRLQPLAGCQQRPSIDAAVRRVLRRLDSLYLLGAFSDAYPNVEAEMGIDPGRAGAASLLPMHGSRSSRRAPRCSGTSTCWRSAAIGYTCRSRCARSTKMRSLGSTWAAPPGAARLAVVDDLLRAGLSVGVNTLRRFPVVTDTPSVDRRRRSRRRDRVLAAGLRRGPRLDAAARDASTAVTTSGAPTTRRTERSATCPTRRGCDRHRLPRRTTRCSASRSSPDE